MKMRFRKLMAWLLALCLLAGGSAFATAIPETPDGATFAEQFKDIETTGVGGMVRWWLPGSNLDQAELAREVYALKEAGFAGAEVVYHKVYDGGNGDGWMSEQWIESCLTILNAAKECGLQIDFMMTGGNLSIPVDDPSATLATDRQLSKQITEVVLEPGYDGSAMAVEIGIPEANAQVYMGKLISISAAKVLSVAEDGMVTLDIDSVIGNYTAMDESDTRFAKEETRLDAFTAEDLTVEIAFPANDTDAAITYNVFALWQVPTAGQFGTMYYIDHLSPEGANAILAYYDAAIAEHPELGELLSEVGGCLFGDSLELTNTGEWSYTMLEEFYDQYGYDCAPYLISLFNTARRGFGFPGMQDDTVQLVYDFADGKGDAFRNSYYATVTDLYIKNHVAIFEAWAQQYGMHYRGQSTYNYYAFNSEASLDIPVTETESLHFKDYTTPYRAQAGSAHVGNGTGIYSSEVGEEMNRAYMQTWQEELWHMNRLFIAGVNNIIHHGFAYATNLEDPNETWPGYLGMFSCGNDLKTFFPSFAYLNDYNDYTARVSFLLRQGHADVDLAVFNYEWNLQGENTSNLYGDDGLIDSLGYNFDIIQPAFFDLEGAVVEDGVLFPESASYKAILFDNETSLPLATAQKLAEYAQTGLPMVFVGGLPTVVGEYTGTADGDEAAQAAFDEAMAALAASDCVRIADAYAQVPELLGELGVFPDAAYDANRIMTAHRAVENADYYFISNQTALVDWETRWQNEEGVEADITFQGNGKPYELNLWTGDITPIAEYAVNEDGSITLHVTLAANDSRAFAIAEDGWYTGEAVDDLSAIIGDADFVYGADGALTLRATSAGDYAASLSDGSSFEATVEAVPEAQVLENWHLQFINHAPVADEVTYWNTVQETVYDADIGAPVSFNALDDLEGCENMSGVGIYTTTIAWDSSTASGAYLDLGTVKDLYRLYVNDTEVPGANPLDPRFDIGAYLVDGENTLRVEAASNLYNAVVGVRGYSVTMPSSFGGNAMEMLPDELSNLQFGLLGQVVLTPYCDVAVNG